MLSSSSPVIRSVEVWTDAAVYENTGVVVLGWVVRVDGRSVESKGAVDNTCTPDSSLAELAAMRQGLTRALARGYQSANVVLYSDHKAAVDKIESMRTKFAKEGKYTDKFWPATARPTRAKFEELCLEVIALADKFHRGVRITWVRREQNHAADWITRCYGKHADKQVRRCKTFADACKALTKIEEMMKAREHRYVSGAWQHSRWNE